MSFEHDTSNEKAGKDTSMMALLDIFSWNSFCPVLLPLGPSTMSPVIAGSLGVFIPFLFFAIMLFYYLHSIWLLNIFPAPPTSGKAAMMSDGAGNQLMYSSNLGSYRPSARFDDGNM